MDKSAERVPAESDLRPMTCNSHQLM